jgi:hypothetical protein
MVTSMAAILAITGGAYAVLRGQNPGSDPVAAAAADLPVSHAGKALEQQRQHMIQLDAAAKTMTTVGAPKVATQPAASAPTGTTGTAAGGTGGGGGGGTGSNPPPSGPPPGQGTPQSIAYKMLPSFGFTASTEFPCLNEIYIRESGWRWNAQNASGAYGIPQALPGSKMASAGADWATNPATQIKWGIGYIKGRYGSPCAAWSYWQAHGYY